MKTLSLFCWTLLLTLPASYSLGETLHESLSSTYNYNPTLLSERASARANDENLSQARSGYRPNISLTGDTGIERTKSYVLGNESRTELNPRGYGIRLSQNIFDGLRTLNSVDAALSGIYASREVLRNVEQNVLLSAVRSYVDVLRLTDLVDLRRRNIEFLDEQYRSAEARLDVGEGTRTDVAQSEAQRALARAQLSASEALLESAREVYLRTTGLEPSDLTWPDGPTDLYPSSASEAVRIGLTEHPSIRAGQHLVDAARSEVDAARSSLLPRLDLQASASDRYDISGTVDKGRNLQATLNLSVPLYQSGLATSSVRRARETLVRRRLDVDRFRIDVRSEIISSWWNLRSSESNYDANLEQVRAGRLALEGVIEERDVGQRTQLDVLDAQNVVLRAEELALESRASRILAGYGLVASIGRLSSRTLDLSVEHYDPASYLGSPASRTGVIELLSAPTE